SPGQQRRSRKQAIEIALCVGISHTAAVEYLFKQLRFELRICVGQQIQRLFCDSVVSGCPKSRVVQDHNDRPPKPGTVPSRPVKRLSSQGMLDGSKVAPFPSSQRGGQQNRRNIVRHSCSELSMENDAAFVESGGLA